MYILLSDYQLLSILYIHCILQPVLLAPYPWTTQLHRSLRQLSSSFWSVAPKKNCQNFESLYIPHNTAHTNVYFHIASECCTIDETGITKT